MRFHLQSLISVLILTASSVGLASTDTSIRVLTFDDESGLRPYVTVEFTGTEICSVTIRDAKSAKTLPAKKCKELSSKLQSLAAKDLPPSEVTSFHEDAYQVDYTSKKLNWKRSFARFHTKDCDLENHCTEPPQTPARDMVEFLVSEFRSELK